MAKLLDTLYIALKADTNGFEQGMSGVRAQLRNLGSDLKLPVVGAVGLASSLLAVGAAATGMAVEVDKGVKRATASMPLLRARTGELRDEIEKLSRETGFSQAALSDAFATAATTGVRSFTELTDVVRSAVRVSEATGEDIGRIIGGMDVALDAFNLTATQTAEAGAKLYAAAQGKFGFTKLTDAIQRAAPTIRDFNLDFDVTVGTLRALLEEGRDPRQAAQRLKELAKAGEDGAAEMRSLAGELVPTAEAMERLRVAAQTSREEASTLASILKAQLNAELIDLGNEILPTVIRGMQGLLAKIRELRQTYDKESFFAGTELTLPDTQGGLRTFIAQNEQALKDLERQQRKAKELSDKAGEFHLGDLLYLPGFLQAHQAQRTVPADAALKLVTDEIERLESATTSAKAKLAELLAANRTLPDLVVTANRPTGPAKLGEDAKRAKRALEELLDLELRFRHDFLDRFKSEATIVGEKVKELNAELAGGSPEQRAEGERVGRLVNQWKQLDQVLGDFIPHMELTAPAVADVRDESDKLATGIGRVKGEVQQLTDGQLLTQALRHLRDIADTNAGLFRVADAVVAISNATGLLGDDATRVLQQFVALGESANDLGETIGRFNLGQASTGELLGAAGNFGISIANTIATAFQDSPELKAAREALERVAEELRKNTLGLQAFRQSGSDLGRIEKAIAEFTEKGLPGLLNGRSRVSQTAVTDELEKFGLTIDDLRQFAKDANLPFVELTRETLPEFLQFLEDLGIKIDQIQQAGFFGTGASARLDKTRAGFTFSAANETGGQQFADLIKAALLGDDPSQLLKDAFAGIDFSNIDDPSVQAAARDAVRQLFTTVTAEGFDNFEGLGDFSGAEFIAFLQELLGLIPEIEDAPPPDKAQAVNDAIAAFSRSVRVFDTSTLDQAKQFLGVLGGFSPALAGLIGEMDLSTVEGIDAATAVLQDFFARVESGEISLEGTGLTVDLLVDAIDRLQAASTEAKDEVARLAEEEAKRAEEAKREAERQAADAQREAERQAAEAKRAADQAEADRVARGEQALKTLREEFTLFDVSNVVDQVQELAGVLQAGGPIFRQLLGGLDLTSAGGRSDALARLQQFAVANPLGVSSGTFGASTVRQATLDLAELLKQANAVDVTQGQSGSFAINRTITEASADRISGLIGTTNIILGGIAADVAAIARALGVPTLPPLVPPAIPAALPSGAAVGTASIHIGTIAITMDGQTITGDPSPLVADLIRQLSQALAADAARAAMGA